ncbi:MAG: hypothetical protein N0E48_11390, partial [Candidatus Thiodiazotropha endolucinida]|nr:hypothetical protein [Candidatus Thiodiazotropha taylori]MCW4343945.1 hypothetical protein [Candidatus Thiodiazotropha endolucinida]
MSNAERQRRFRERRDADENRRREYLLKSKEKYRNDKTSGKRKLVKDMTGREKRHQRKLWRNQKRKEKERQKALLLTPPASPEILEIQQICSRQKKQENKVRNRDRAKCYRDLKNRDKEIEILNRKVEMYKKRWLREKGKHLIETPRTKTRNLLKNVSRNFKDHKFSKLRRNLFMNNVVIQQIRQKYKDEKKGNKRKIASIFSGPILRKYGVRSAFNDMLGVRLSRRKRKEKSCLTTRIRKSVTAFYLRTDNSRFVSGLKNTKSHCKKKRQKRILLDTLKNLHVKFLAEAKNRQISYSLFCRLRPFWVVCPVESDRQTCLCRRCDNIQLQLKELSKVSSLSQCVEDVVKERVCSMTNRDCMFQRCAICEKKSRSYSLTKNKCDEMQWQQWQRKTERREIRSGKESKVKDITITVKETCKGTLGELMSSFESNLVQYMQHIYNCRSQFWYYKQSREQLQSNECLVHIDFSENYNCRLESEVQEMHFGASKKQITLQTGIYYTGNETSGQTFCTVSDSIYHGPAAIWCHLSKVLAELKQKNKNLDTIEFFSDGPLSQYRQKGNFYMLTQIPIKFGFQNVKWSFFESGHGKGIPDAVGGSLKREANRRVKYGHDITCAKDFVENLNGCKTKLWVIDEGDVEKEREKLDNVCLKPITGTLKLHQIIVDTQDSNVYYRDLSCMCAAECKHYLTKKANLTEFKNDLQEKQGVQNETRDTTEQQQESKKPKRKLDGGKTVPETVKRKRTDKTSIDNSMDKRNDFKRYLHQLNTCKTFAQLQNECKKISNNIDELFVDPSKLHLLMNGIEIDESASDYIPSELLASELLACKVHSDGNCLPSTASVFAYCNKHQVDEMRVRIILEQVKHEKHYLNDNFLQTGKYGRSMDPKRSTKKQYAMYSESFIPGRRLTNESIKSIYRKEVLSITRNMSFMGIWQIHALSSILKIPIYSAYPDLGNSNVRKDLHKVVKPIQETNSDPVFILWTSNREDMTVEHWVPNHFVPLLKLRDTPDMEINSVNNNTGNTQHKVCQPNCVDQETTSEDNVTIYVYNMADAEDDSHEETTSSGFVLKKIDGTHYEYVLQNNVDRSDCKEDQITPKSDSKSESADRVENSDRTKCTMDNSKSAERVENSQGIECNLGNSGPSNR